jgi:HSP20 family protein
MALVRWTPMHNLLSFQEEMNRMFNGFFRSGGDEEVSWGLRTWSPPVDIYETDDALVLTAEMLGVSKDDVGIEIHENNLTLWGQRTHRAEVHDDRYHRRKRVYGDFQRSSVLPLTVDHEKVQATYRDGILELRLPKLESAKPKRIAIAG